MQVGAKPRALSKWNARAVVASICRRVDVSASELIVILKKQFDFPTQSLVAVAAELD